MTFFISQNESETEKIGYEFAKELKSGDFVLLNGNLGSGKTCFTRGVSSYFNVKNVHSPTFSIINRYKGNSLEILHLDLYRIQDVHNLDLNYYFGKKNQIVLIEWAEKLGKEKPLAYINVNITIDKDNLEKRMIHIDKIWQ